MSGRIRADPRFDRPKLLALEEAATPRNDGLPSEWRDRLQQDERLRRFLKSRFPTLKSFIRLR